MSKQQWEWAEAWAVAAAISGVIIVALGWAASCGGCRAAPQLPGSAPVRAVDAVMVVAGVVGRTIPGSPIPDITWVTEDQCGRGEPSILWRGTECVKGVSLDCAIYVAAVEPLSQSALVSEWLSCVSRHLGDAGPSVDYDALETEAISALKAEGL